MHPIIRQARFARRISDSLQTAYDEGQILEPDQYLTSEEASFVYSCCDDEWEVEEVVFQLLEGRRDRFIAEMFRQHGGGPADVTSESHRRDMRDSGRGHLLS